MNKAVDLYNSFYAEVKDIEKSKKCVIVFVEEMEKLLTGELEKHSFEWWAYRLQEIREDLKEL